MGRVNWNQLSPEARIRLRQATIERNNRASEVRRQRLREGRRIAASLPGGVQSRHLARTLVARLGIAKRTATDDVAELRRLRGKRLDGCKTGRKPSSSEQA